MSSISVPRTGFAGHRSMAAIEVRRLVKHPVFVVGTVLAFALLGYQYAKSRDEPGLVDLLSQPIIPAFFIGLSSLIAMARLTRSTEVTAEALGTAPHTEARRTVALLLACLVPFAAGAVWVALMLALIATSSKAVVPQEWWFDTLPDWQVWSILLVTGPVACLGAALLGVLTGRWMPFRGAPAVVVVALVLVCMVGQVDLAYSDQSVLRLWLPWAMFHSGSQVDGTQVLFAGNPAAYAGYALCLCAAAALAAIWHDRAARTTELRALIASVVVVGLGCLVLAMTTSETDNRISDPVPFMVEPAAAGIRFDPA